MEKISYSQNHTDFYSEDYSYNFDDSDLEDETYKLGNTIFDVNTMLGMMDADIYNPIDLIFMDDSAEGRISLAYERLSRIPRPLADHFAQNTHTLDLSHNNIKDLSFLANFKHLNTLILDKNDAPEVDTLPPLPNLQILWLNNCSIYDLAKWVKRIQACCPNLRQLSLLGNPGILSTFNGGTSLEHLDYRMYVIGNLSQLDYLDDTIVTDAQRFQAETHKSVYTKHEHDTTPNQLVERFTGLNLFRYDRPTRSRPDAQKTSSKKRNSKTKSKVATDSSSQG